MRRGTIRKGLLSDARKMASPADGCRRCFTERAGRDGKREPSVLTKLRRKKGPVPRVYRPQWSSRKKKTSRRTQSIEGR